MHIILETPRLILRCLQDSDLIPLARKLNNRRITMNTASIPWPYTLDDAYAYQRLPIDERRTLRTMIIEKSGDGHLIGGIGYDAHPTLPCAEIGYWLDEDVWGKGYGLEAAQAVTHHAFSSVGHTYLLAGYRKGNEASRRILGRLGFRVTGHTKGYSKGAACFVPVTRLELTSSEWQKHKGRH